jgi:hypothetical protein
MNDGPFIPSWLDDAGLPPAAYRVLCHLWRRRHTRTGQCNPSADSIAKACRIKRKTVWTALREAEAKGFLSRNKLGFRASNNYTLHVPATGAQSGPIESSQPVPQTDLQSVPYGPLQGSPSEGSPIIATGSAAGEEIGELFQTSEALTPEQSKHTPIHRPRKTRKRNELLDALAALDGSDTEQIPESAWCGIAKQLREIKAVCHNLTVDEILRRAGNYRLHFPNAPEPSSYAMAKHWARCDLPPADRSRPAKPDAPLRMISQ